MVNPQASEKRRIAVVFPAKLRAFHWTKDPGLIATGLAGLGHDVMFVCPGHDPLEDFDLQGVRVVAQREMADPEFWGGLGCDGAIVYSWLGHSELLAAVAAGGAKVVAKGDS